MPGLIRSRLTFSNVIAFLALLLAIGGGAYAAVTLPAKSVGTKQLRKHSVTAKKLANKSVHRRALSKAIQQQLDRAGSQSPGTPGTPTTPSSPDAKSFNFFQAASENPTPETILDFAGLRFVATCTLSGSTTTLDVMATSSTDAVLQDNFNVDGGTDPRTPSTPTSGNLQIDLPAGVQTDLSGPGVDPPQYFRVIATAIISTQGRAMTINITEFVDGDAETCRIDGTILAP